MGNCARVSRSSDPIIHAPIKDPLPLQDRVNLSPNSKSPQEKTQAKSAYQNDYGVLNLISYMADTTNCEYNGDISNQQRNGKGVFKWPDSTIYSGYWQMDKANGKGLLQFPNGDSYEGDFVENRYEGYGKYINSKGVAYEGNWHNNLQNGNGIETFSDKTRFEGEYKNGKKNGNGKIGFSDGSFFEGNFIGNNIEGYGKLTWPSSENKIYEGEWMKNVMEGKGKMTWLDTGKMYEGAYKDDKKHGLGGFKWGTGEKWIGYWKGGIRHGKGIFIDKNNKMMEKGEWNMGKKTEDFEPNHQNDEGFEEIFDYLLRNYHKI